jgi:aldose 1-epimerase
MKTLGQFILLSAAGLGAAFFVGCATMSNSSASAIDTITKAPFGKTSDGAPVEIYTLRNANGCEARIMTYGGIVQSLKVPDRNGQLGDVVLGYDTVDAYIAKTPYFGALIGRYGNRIGGAKFTLEGKTYKLAANNGANSLHGGVKSFDKVVWKAVKADVGPQGPRLELNYLSKDGEEGFPGNLNVTAVYTLTDDNALDLRFKATTDKPTLCNLTHHSYFNLRGQGNGDILGHEVYINANEVTAVNSQLIPTGKIESVDGTPFDFRKPTAIGARINDPNTELQYGPGYDHNWIINKPLGQLGLVARVYEPTSGRVMEVESTEPGTQFYAGNSLDGMKGKGGAVYKSRTGFCIEPQHYPDSPNHPDFPSTELKPGETYTNIIIYKFSTKK